MECANLPYLPAPAAARDRLAIARAVGLGLEASRVAQRVGKNSLVVDECSDLSASRATGYRSGTMRSR